MVTGVESLTGAEVEAEDLRGGAALVIAGLSAAGVTRVHDAGHIERGYADLAETLRSLGAEIRRE
jgi:UDP-N-acetylglucosamine 1-carboxyvinyltransferase